MKAFIKKTIVYVLSFILITFFIILMGNRVTKVKAQFVIDENIKNVIVGHSMPEYAYNDSIISSFKNLGNSGETYFYTFQKIKPLIAQNPQIEHLFIEFTNNTIIKAKDLDIYSEKYMRHHYPMYSAFISLEDQLFLFKKNWTSYLKSQSQALKFNAYTLKNNTYDYIKKIGAYKKGLKSFITDKTINKAEIKEDRIRFEQLSTYNLMYLKKIVTYCQEHNVKPYLLRSPYHKNSILSSNEQAFQGIKDSLFNDVIFLDFKNFPLDDDDFTDYTHLNVKGATKFSRSFNRVLSNGLLNSATPNKLITREINKVSH